VLLVCCHHHNSQTDLSLKKPESKKINKDSDKTIISQTKEQSEDKSSIGMLS